MYTSNQFDPKQNLLYGVKHHHPNPYFMTFKEFMYLMILCI